MNQPRYRVKTLLVATTIAAVVVACLAPWLRLMTESQLGAVLARGLCIGFGAAIANLSTRRSYRKLYSQQCEADQVFHLQTVRVHRHSMVPITLLSLFAATATGLALLMDWKLRHFPFSAYFLWFGVGSCLAVIWLEVTGREGDALLTSTLFVHPEVSTLLHDGHLYHWIDRTEGLLEVTIMSLRQFELRVRPEDIDAVDALLASKLSPRAE